MQTPPKNDSETIEEVKQVILQILQELGYSRVFPSSTYHYYDLIEFTVQVQDQGGYTLFQFNVNVKRDALHKVRIIPSVLPPVSLTQHDSITMLKTVIAQVPLLSAFEAIGSKLTDIEHKMSEMSSSLNDLLSRFRDGNF